MQSHLSSGSAEETLGSANGELLRSDCAQSGSLNETLSSYNIRSMQYFGNRSASCFVTSVRNPEKKVLQILAAGRLHASAATPSTGTAFVQSLRKAVILKALMIPAMEAQPRDLFIQIVTTKLQDNSLFDSHQHQNRRNSSTGGSMSSAILPCRLKVKCLRSGCFYRGVLANWFPLWD
jgi:hypothetical protein